MTQSEIEARCSALDLSAVDYLVYDVFTDTPFGGNQLAVFPNASALPEDQLQSITAEFNFSEVTFVYPPKDPAHTARVRIFTPTSEVPFAGHPTIGTAIALHNLGIIGDMMLELGVGPLPCTFEGDKAAFKTSVPLETLATPDPALVAAALGLSSEQIRLDVHVPTQCSLGLPFVIAQLVDRAALTACRPVTDKIREGAQKHPAGMDFAIFAYVTGPDHIDARMFAPLDNIPEDPATGSASAALGALLFGTYGTQQSLSIAQGEDMGRTSQIGVVADETGVTVSGHAVQTMRGTLLTV